MGSVIFKSAAMVQDHNVNSASRALRTWCPVNTDENILSSALQREIALVVQAPAIREGSNYEHQP